jgi:putative ABC transport system permease protein
MIDSLYLAWQYIRFNKVKTIILVASITLIAVLPLALEVLLAESERQLLSRAQTTPLLIGAKGSSLDLAMNSLYFDDEVPELMTMEAADRVYDTELALPIPLYVRFLSVSMHVASRWSAPALTILIFAGLRSQMGNP